MLSENQKGFFVRNGFVQVENALTKAACEKLVEETWRKLPSQWERDRPETWTGEVEDSCHTADLGYRRGHLKFQDGALRSSPEVLDSFGPGSYVHGCAMSLIGRPLTTRVRGLYPNVPPPSVEQLPVPTKPHVEAHVAQLVMIAYLSDVLPKGGGLLVWPGSHVPLYSAFGSKMEFVATEAYKDLFARHCALEPIELPGKRGDLIFTHHRLFHAPSLNRSSAIRFALLCDYTPEDWKVLSAQSPGQDIWEDWPALKTTATAEQAVSDYAMQPLLVAKHKVVGPTLANPTTQRKADASRLARARQPGDIWLVLSDRPDMARDTRLDPCGSDLAAQGVQVYFNGELVRPKSCHDIIGRVQLKAGQNRITIKKTRADVWLRLVRISVPFSESQVIFTTKVPDPQEKRVILVDLGENGLMREVEPRERRQVAANPPPQTIGSAGRMGWIRQLLGRGAARQEVWKR